MFALDPKLDAAALAKAYARNGRVQIEDFLAPDGANALFEALEQRSDWHQVLNAGDKVYELSRDVRAGMSAQKKANLDAAVHGGARDGFQFRFESIRVPDDAEARAASPDILARFAEFMSGGSTRDFLRHVVGVADVAFADVQATAYGPGDFLTIHHDEVEGKGRRAAYVFGLTRSWRPEWGGLLLFHDANGDVEHGWSPRFNTLNLFRVPQPHSVSLVTPAAPYPRRSITGWLRSR